MMTAADKKSKKQTHKNAAKETVKPDMLMSEDMKNSLLSEHSSKHGKPANESEFYHKKISAHPEKK
ncbi:MAG: hypothetical protein JST50_05035 [Bacteroidetes bacterium]|jgi:hypothetical protein|nr:hypothetical protein [Bacteroidota bacterium]